MLKPTVTENSRAKCSLALDILRMHAEEPEERLDDLTRDAAALLEAPYAMINFLTSDRVIFKSCAGLKQGDSMDIKGSFCLKATKQDEPLHIIDTELDPEFVNYELVTGPLKIRSYLAAALHTSDGDSIGTLCLMETKPRQYTAEQLDLLAELADSAEQQLKLMVERALPYHDEEDDLFIGTTGEAIHPLTQFTGE
jgi:GAF domain-containing protein